MFFFQIIDICIAKYGSLAAATEEVNRKEDLKFSRSLGLTSTQEKNKKLTESKNGEQSGGSIGTKPPS